jgi:Iap family predicted aminopeptidase
VAGLFTNKIKMTNEQIREHLLKAGVKNLKEFGYPEVTTETILTDEVYKEFFKSMLEENLGNGKQVDEVINQLLSDVG